MIVYHKFQLSFFGNKYGEWNSYGPYLYWLNPHANCQVNPDIHQVISELSGNKIANNLLLPKFNSVTFSKRENNRIKKWKVW